MIEFTDLEEVLLVTPPVVFEDFRGTNVEIFNKAFVKSPVEIVFSETLFCK